MDRNKAIILADGLRCESLSARRAWIEIKVPEDQYTALSSLSARRAWIEIVLLSYNQCVAVVALRKESVDRNTPRTVTPSRIFVVALRKESVDRNMQRSQSAARSASSLSARRAWIEIVLIVEDGKEYARRSPQGERG